MNTLIVTRHQALIELLSELGITGKVVPHATADDVRDRVVVGVLPLHLAALAKAVIVPVLELRPEDRGRELGLEETRERFRRLQIFRVFSASSLIEAEESLSQALAKLRFEGWNGFGFQAPALEGLFLAPALKELARGLEEEAPA